MPQSLEERRKNREALVKLVLGEIELYKQEKIDRLSTNAELATVGGYCPGYVSQFLQKNLETTILLYREKMIHSDVARKAMKCEIGIWGRTPSQRAEYRRYGSKMGGRRAAELKVGAHGRTPEQMSEHFRKWGRVGGKISGKINGKLVSERHRRNAFFVLGRFYASSKQEAAVALLFESYIDYYRVADGVNFQVRKSIDNGGIDFFVNGTFVEWHPIALYYGRRGDIRTLEEYVSHKNCLEHLRNPEERKSFVAEYKQVIAMTYLQKRQAAVDNSPHSGKEVIVLQDVKSLYDFLSRYSTTLPSYDEFQHEFKRLVKEMDKYKVKKADLPKEI